MARQPRQGRRQPVTRPAETMVRRLTARFGGPSVRCNVRSVPVPEYRVPFWTPTPGARPALSGHRTDGVMPPMQGSVTQNSVSAWLRSGPGTVPRHHAKKFGGSSCRLCRFRASKFST
jgi:hypothetical protein